MRADRILLKNIIKTWKEIKSLRETDKCINTSLKLIIKKSVNHLYKLDQGSV